MVKPQTEREKQKVYDLSERHKPKDGCKFKKKINWLF